MFREHREGSLVVGKVPDTETIVWYERMQAGRKIVEEGARLKLRLERPRHSGETDEDVRFGNRRPVLWRGAMHARAQAAFYPMSVACTIPQPREASPGAAPASAFAYGVFRAGSRRVGSRCSYQARKSANLT